MVTINTNLNGKTTTLSTTATPLELDAGEDALGSDALGSPARSSAWAVVRLRANVEFDLGRAKFGPYWVRD